MRQNQRDLALRVLEQQLVAKSASPAGSNELLEQTLCVQQRGALGQGSRHGATGQSVNRKENVNRLHVTCYLKNASRNVQQKQASHKQFYSIILIYNTLYNDLEINGKHVQLNVFVHETKGT